MKNPSQAVPRSRGAGEPEQEHRVPQFAELNALTAADDAEKQAVAARRSISKRSRSKRKHPLPGEYLAAGSRRPPRQSAAATVLHRDAVAALHVLKQKHAALFDANPQEFRRQINRARSLVLSLRRGPRPDPVIASAAREVAAGARVEDIFKAQYPGRKESDEQVYAMALANFRSKVNAYRRRHPRLKHQRDRRKTRTSPAETAA
jgi:hypothetical protein